MEGDVHGFGGTKSSHIQYYVASLDANCKKIIFQSMDSIDI